MIRSASLRFALLFGVVFAASALALVLFLWLSTANLLDRQVEAAINADAQGLVERWSEGGIPSLLLTIQDRLAEQRRRRRDLRGVRPARRHRRRQSRPMAVARRHARDDLRAAGQPRRHRSLADVRRYDLPGGFRLLVGRDVRGRVELRRLLTSTLLSSMLVVALLPQPARC